MMMMMIMVMLMEKRLAIFEGCAHIFLTLLLGHITSYHFEELTDNDAGQ